MRTQLVINRVVTFCQVIDPGAYSYRQTHYITYADGAG